MRKKFLAGLLALVMLLSLVPVTAFAAEGETEGDSTLPNVDGLHTVKTVEVKDDGTFDINLEAWVTGEVTSSSSTKPCDIVLLLDQSGSMSDVLGTQTSGNYVLAKIWLFIIPISIDRVSTANLAQQVMTLYVKNSDDTYSSVYISESGGTYTVTKQETDEVVYTGSDIKMDFYRYQTSSTETSKQEGLMAAAKSFIEATGDKNDAITDAAQKHRIALVKFAGTESTTTGNDTYGDYEYNYTQIVQELTSDETTLLQRLGELSEAGATSADYGMNRAAAALGDLSADDGRQKIIIMFTDGEPNHGNGFSDSVAAATINKAQELKEKNVTIYTIGVLKGADPELDPTLASTSDINKYLHAVSSNYPDATATNNFTVTWGNTGSYTDGFYKTATTSSELNSIFQEIQNSVGSAKIDLGSQTVLKDIVGTGFALPENFNSSDDAKIELFTATYTGNDTFADPVAAPETVTATVNGKTIDVTGFDYSENYVVDGSSDGQVKTGGKKLIVKITGLEIDPDMYQDGIVYTNGVDSGIYDGNGDLVENFPRPFVMLGKHSYVVDYAKSFDMHAEEFNQEDFDHLAIDPTGFETPNLSGLDLTNGKVVVKDKTTLNYTPQTTNWNGYDTFYVFGHTRVDVDAVDLWSQVNVIPANNVYYEDTFVSTEEGTTEADAVVGIAYGDNWKIVTDNEGTEGAEGTVTETPDGAVMGWEENLADDKSFSNGAAHVSDTSGATASFEFTGTGVDIYSYTDIKSGMIIASLYREGQTVANKTLFMDNLAVSGEYYQIPTLSFGPETSITVKNEDGSTTKAPMDYGTYTVKLTVVGGKAVETDENGVAMTDENGNLIYSEEATRSTYYLDGIRIYNPLGQTVTDDTVVDAYDPTADQIADSIQSVFTEVRTILDAADDRMVFIDMNDKGEIGATDYGPSEVNTTYGPKNEVYLDAGDSIVFAIDGFDANNLYYVGLKSLTGDTVKAAFTDDASGVATDITHTTDLYYKVTPAADGKVIVRNASESGILSVTKIQAVIPGAATFTLRTIASEEAETYAAAFMGFELGEYQQPVVEEPVEPEIPEEPTEPETPEVPDIDIEIENPEPKPEKTPVRPILHHNLKKLVNNLFNQIHGWFGR